MATARPLEEKGKVCGLCRDNQEHAWGNGIGPQAIGGKWALGFRKRRNQGPMFSPVCRTSIHEMGQEQDKLGKCH